MKKVLITDNDQLYTLCQSTKNILYIGSELLAMYKNIKSMKIAYPFRGEKPEFTQIVENYRTGVSTQDISIVNLGTGVL